MKNIGDILLMILPLLFAITAHEAAHAFAAKYYGDTTAEKLGRLTFNPVAHIDPIGTILVPLGMMLFSTALGVSGIIFGWAKPVPIVVGNFKNPRQGMRMTALAGPVSNLIQMFIWGAILAGSTFVPETFSKALSIMSYYGIMINAVLFTLNMLPIPPLDGSRVVDSFLPYNLSRKYNQLEQYGMFIVLFLLMSGVLSYIMMPIVMLLIKITTLLFNISL